MLRKKNQRDPIGSLELGGAVQMTKSFRVKRISYKKILKYVILIILGIAIHSIYREIFQAHHVEELQQNKEPIEDSINLQSKNEPLHDAAPVEVPVNQEPPGGRILDDVNGNHHESVDRKAEDMAERIFRENEHNMAQNQETFGKPLDQNQVFKEANEENVAEHRAEESARIIEADEIPAPVDQAPFEQIVDLKEDVLENENINRAEQEIQKEIGNIMEDTYDEIKNPAGVQEEPPPNNPEVEPAKEVQKIQEAVKKVEEIPKSYREVVRPHDHGLPNLVTAALKKDILKVEQLILSVQRFFPDEKIYVYDIDLEPRQHKLLSAMCNVRMRHLLLDVFPKFVQNVTNFHWRPLVMHLAVTEFEHITWLNHKMRLKNSKKLLSQYPKAHDTSVLVLGHAASYTTFAVTHPDMYKFIKTDRKELSKHPHIEIFALIMHNTAELREHFMKHLLSCTMDPACLAPPGSRTNCDFDFSGRLYAKCHQYDESAINILLKNWFQFDKAKFSAGNCCFSDYDPNERIRPQICHRRIDEKIEDL
ncbi:uncharacterized protein [Argopecten irradians]|uniref:uncharacterized protein n=1 Tax=Argopecten irradians TaxID=31199 RepID=UPI00370FA39B